jgi:Domain of unknown function DUF11
MKYFNNQTRSPQSESLMGLLRTFRFAIFARILPLFLFALLWVGQNNTYAQACTTPAPSVLAGWDFTSRSNTVCSEGARQYSSKHPDFFGFQKGEFYYCPSSTLGCAAILLKSDGHYNTGFFSGAICLFNFYNSEIVSSALVGGAAFNPNSTTWNPTAPVNFYISYKIPAGKSGCLTGFSLKILQKQFKGTVNFEKQGVAVYRDGVQIYSTTQNILANNVNGTDMVFDFPSTTNFCSDGSNTKPVEFKVYFGLVRRLVPPGGLGTAAETGYDDVKLMGTCGGSASKIPAAVATKATCSATGANSNGTITLSNFDTGSKFAYTTGATYTGTATFASGSTAIPANGVIVNNLPDPTTAQKYTVRVFTATCYRDLTVTLNPSGCITPCVKPTATLTPTMATCTGGSADNDAQIAITGIANGNKVGISKGSTYTGTGYDNAQTIAGGIYTYSNLDNPTTAQVYTIRVFNGSTTCFKDFTTTLNPASCVSICDFPSGMVLTPTIATCTGGTANNDAQIAVTGVIEGNKAGISMGNTYTGADYTTAKTLTSGAYTFTALNNPATSQIYTVRVFNESGSCFIDQTVILSPKTCTVACTLPTATISTTKATCTGGIANNNASINLTGISNGDKIGYSEGSTYTGSNYADAGSISGGAFSIPNLSNPTFSQAYTIRIYNGSDACFKDFTSTIDPVNCAPTCTLPTGTVLTSTLATCTGITPNNDASIAVSGVTGGDKVGISMGNTYTGAAYATAQTLSSGAYTFTALNNPAASQIYTVRVFNASNSCFSDYSVILESKACPCVKPTANLLATKATCTGTTANNNASIAVTGVTNGNRVGVSAGATYTGAAYATAQTLTAGAFTFSNLNNPVASQIYTIRVFNASDACFTDFQTSIDPTNCAPSCVFPSGMVITSTLATCTGSSANNNASIAITAVSNGNKVGMSAGSTYTGADYATAQTLASGAYTYSALANPNDSQVYTIRIFNTNSTCYTDRTVTLLDKDCPCVAPTGVLLTATDATCTGTTANNNASIAITGVSGGSRVGLSAGATYTGPAFATAQALTGGAYTFSGLSNPTGSQTYTVRTFLDAGCFVDKQAVIDETECGACRSAYFEVISTDATDADSKPDNGVATEDDHAAVKVCATTATIDLKLSQTVSPTSGNTCGSTGTTFVWTTTIQNEGTMTATDIVVRNLLPVEMYKVSAVTNRGVISANWEIPSLAPGAGATLTVTAKALVRGTFKYTAEVIEASPDNDSDSTPDNGITTEDDYAEATITVVGNNAPAVSKEFSPMYSKPNTPVRLIVKITNNESTPVTLTNDFIDVFPTAPAAMVIAATPSLNTSGFVLLPTGITATAGAGSITIPKGTILVPGLNQLAINVTAPSDGVYCNTVAAEALQTTAGNNCLAAEACVSLLGTFDVAPTVKKTMLPAVIQAGQNAVLTITIENKNTTAMTLNSEFVDYLPDGLLATGAVTSSCGGANLRNANKELVLAAGTSIAANSTCTITVNVTSSTAGYYCNLLGMNSVLTTVGTNNNLGNEDYAEACLTVTATPCTSVTIPSITPSKTSDIKIGDAVTITPTITGSDSKSIYRWSVSPANGSRFDFNATGNTSTWKPTAPGNYTLKLLVDNQLTGPGTCKDSVTVAFMVLSDCESPLVTAVPKTQTICAGSSAAAYAVNLATGVEYKWYGPLADTTSSLGTAIAGQTTALFPPTGTALTTAGTKYYAVVVNNTGDIACADTAFVQLVVNAKPTIADGTAIICGGETVDLTSKIASYGTYLSPVWTVATASGTSVSTPTAVKPSATTTYVLVAQNALGCKDTANVVVTVNAKPNAGTDQNLTCANVGTNTLTTSTTLVPVTAGGTFTQIGTTPALATIAGNAVSNMTVAGTYQFQYSVAGCLDTVAVIVQPCTGCVKPNAGTDAAAICQPNTTAKLTAVTTGGTWSAQTGNPATATIDNNGNITGLSTAGTYKFIYSVTGGGITCTDTAQVVVNAKPVIADGTAIICAGESVDLTSKITSYGTYLSPVWTVATASGTAVATPTAVKPTTTTTYVLVAQNALGCKDTANVVVTVNAIPAFEAHGIAATCNGVSPNNDARILIYGMSNGSKMGYNAGLTYTGTYGSATAVSGNAASITGLTTSSSITKYTVRIYGADANCYRDVVVILPLSECNTSCIIDAGENQLLCEPISTINLKDAASTEEWVVGTNNPVAAVIDASTGVVTGMTSNGVYSFILRDKTNASCNDEVFIFRSVMDMPSLTSCETSYQLPTTSGVAWSVASGSATVSTSGLITGMTTNGVYQFIATFGTGCSANVDVVKITCACITPNAGADFAICLPKTTANLIDAQSGYEWVIGIGNPAAASIHASTGVITGMTATGTYKFILRKTGEVTCFDEIQITVTNGDTPIVLCNDGSTSYTLVAQAGLTNVIWYNMAGVQVGTGLNLVVKSTTTGLEDGSEAFYFVGQNGTASGCDVELCCPVKFLTQTCCPTPNCVGVTVIKTK